MKEHPIIFSTEMMRAILEGRKTQTRRVIKPQPIITPSLFRWKEDCHTQKTLTEYHCPYGQVGDRLWVKETWKTEQRYDDLKTSKIPPDARILYLADNAVRTNLGIFYPTEIPLWFGRLRTSLFTSRWASRINLEITGLRVERLQEITPEDAVAEGAEYMPSAELRAERLTVSQIVFAGLWDSLNAKRGYGWETNPWVWVIEFKILQ